MSRSLIVLYALTLCRKMIKCTHRRVVEEDLIALADYGKKGELKFK